MFMGTYDGLTKNREKISKMLSELTDGEIMDFDFMIDHLNLGRPSVTIMLGVPGRVKKIYGTDWLSLVNKHSDTIREVITSFGYPQLFSRGVSYTII